LIRCLVRVHVYFYWELLFCYDVFIYLKMNSAKNKFRFLFLRAAVVSYIPTFIFFLLSALTGLIMYAYFEGCDPMKAGTIERPDDSIISDQSFPRHTRNGRFICFSCCKRSFKVLLRSKIPSGMSAKLRTVAASNNRDHARNLSYCCLLALHIMVLFFTHTPFVVNHTINATPPERLQQCF